MNVALYIFDKKKDELRFEVVYMDEIRFICNRHKFSTIYVTSLDNSKRTARYKVSCTEGKVVYDHFWLYQRDDEKAKKIFKEYYTKKKNELNNQVVKLWRRVDLLDRIQVTSGV